MKNLPANLIIEKNKLATPNPWLVLLEIALTNGTNLRFVRNYEDVVFYAGHDPDIKGHWKLNDNAATTTVLDSSGLGHDGTAQRNTNLMRSLIGHWKMNDNAASTTVTDSTAYGHNGTAQQNTSVLHVDGKIDGALTFNGTSDYIVVSDTDDLDIGTSDFSVSFWIKTTTAATMRLISKRDGNIGYEVYTYSTDGITFFIGDSASFVTKVSPTSISDGNWHHVVVTFDRDGDGIIYIDGQLDVTRDISAQSGSLATAMDLYIGRISYSDSFHFNGDLDDVRIYKKVLSPEEVTQLYNSGIGTEDEFVDDGKINGALTFDGVNDEVCIVGSRGSVLDIGTNDFSIAFWIRTTSIDSMLPIFKRDGYFVGYQISMVNGYVGFLLGDTDGYINKPTASASTVHDGNWHHVVMTFDRDSNAIVYIDGNQDGTEDISAYQKSISSAIDLYFSRDASFTGSLDDIRIYNKALTSEEVTRLYNSGRGTESYPAVYTAFPFEIEPTKQDNQGEIPTVTLRVSNVSRLLQKYLDELSGAISSIVKVTVVNAAHLQEDYSELEMTFDVLACHSDASWVVFTLGAPNPLRQRFPLERYMALHCGFVFESVECSYVGRPITGITNAANAKVSVTSHPFVVGDTVKFSDVQGMTEINGQTGTVLDADPDADGNAFIVDIDTTTYSAYTSGGTAGFASCNRTLSDCKRRENQTRFGGFPGIRTGSVRIA